jgi:hypothetical protein
MWLWFLIGMCGGILVSTIAVWFLVGAALKHWGW